MKKSRYIISIFVSLFIISLNVVNYHSAYAQCGSATLSRVFWDGDNHTVEGCIAFPGNYGFTFSGPVNFTAYQNFTGSEGFTLPFGGLPKPLPPHSTLSVYISTPQVSNTVSCTTNSQGYCAPEPPPPPDSDGDGIPDYLDSCPYQGSIGFGIYSNGCPILDSDGDGIPDYLDSCPYQGSIGFGIYSNGCPILDSDGDGVPDTLDVCPGQVSIGFGVTANGCPIPPPPPPSDRDGDGIPDNTDRCPEQASIEYGVYMSGPETGCPIPPPVPPTPPANDRDDDGMLDNEDRCPDEPGPRGNGGCAIIPPACYVSFLARTVYLRSGPGTVYGSVSTKSFRDNPILARGLVTNPNNASETWYELDGGVYVIINPNWVRLGQPCDFNSQIYDGKPIEVADADKDSIPDVIDACVDRGDEGYGIKNDGCPKTVDDVLTDVRQSDPRDIMKLLKCEIQTGEPLSTAPLFVLMTIVESPNPCIAKEEYNRQQQMTPPLQRAQAFFRESQQRRNFFNEIVTCDTVIFNYIVDLIAYGDNQALIDTFISETLGGEDLCGQLQTWRNTVNTIPIPLGLSPQDTINWGILICMPYNLSQPRYQQLIHNLLEIWQLSLNEITCDDINSANRIGNPSQDQLNVFNKLIACRDHNVIIHKPIWTLEKIITNNDNLGKLLDLPCEELISITYCAEINCTPNVELPPVLKICALSDEDKLLMILFIKNYVPKEGEENVEGKLLPAQVNLLYQHINACNAVIEFLNTGVIRQPIILPPPPVYPPPNNNNDQNISTTISPLVPPIVTGVDTRVIIQPITPPTKEGDASSDNLLKQLGIDRPEKDTRFSIANMIGIVYVRDNAIYIRENGVEETFTDDEVGVPYSPILFTINNRRILAYILVQNGKARIRIINLNTKNAIFAQLSENITIDHESRLAYSDSLLVFTGIDKDGVYNLYGIAFSGTAKTNNAYELIENARNASAVEGLGGFVFEQPNGMNNILLWIPNREKTIALTPIDIEIDGTCGSPIGEAYKGKWRFWFLCEEAEYPDEPLLYYHDMETQVAIANDINYMLEAEGANIAAIRLSLGELQGELFIVDDQNIFLYHQREGRYKVVRLFNGTSFVFPLARQ